MTHTAQPPLIFRYVPGYLTVPGRVMAPNMVDDAQLPPSPYCGRCGTMWDSYAHPVRERRAGDGRHPAVPERIFQSGHTQVEFTFQPVCTCWTAAGGDEKKPPTADAAGGDGPPEKGQNDGHGRPIEDRGVPMGGQPKDDALIGRAGRDARRAAIDAAREAGILARFERSFGRAPNHDEELAAFSDALELRGIIDRFEEAHGRPHRDADELERWFAGNMAGPDHDDDESDATEGAENGPGGRPPTDGEASDT